MARPKSITPELIAGIKASQAQGLTRQETASLYGVSVSTVQKYRTPTGSGKPRIADSVAIVARLDAGESVRDIAKAEGISEDTVRRYRREAKGARPYNKP